MTKFYYEQDDRKISIEAPTEEIADKIAEKLRKKNSTSFYEPKDGGSSYNDFK